MSTRRRESLEVAEHRVQQLGKSIGKDAPSGWGYVLCLTEIGDGGRLAYASNCSRESTSAVCCELGRRIERGEERPLDVMKREYVAGATLDEALELLAEIGKSVCAPEVEVNVRVGADEAESGAKEIHARLHRAFTRAEALVLKLRPELLAEETE